jgi:hypothetical protein
MKRKNCEIEWNTDGAAHGENGARAALCREREWILCGNTYGDIDEERIL